MSNFELVYLWVEEYKNIKEQGFNFSPRCWCEFIPEYSEYQDNTETKRKLTDNCQLTIKKNENYVNIFPENINITAIVGENGSGKSSIIKIILMLIFYKKFQLLNPTNTYEQAISQAKITIQNNCVDNMFLIIKQNNELKKITIGEKYKKLNYSEVESIDFFSIHFNYMLDTLYDGAKDNWVKNVYHRNDSYSTPILLEPYKNSDNEEKIDLKTIEYLNNQRILKFYNDIKSDKLINHFFNPNKLRIFHPIINDWGLERELKEGSETHYNYDYKILNMSKLSYKVQKIYANEITRERMGNILNSIKTLYDENKISDINKLYIALKLITSKYYKEKLSIEVAKINKLVTDTKNIKAKEVIGKVIKLMNDQFIQNISNQNNNSYENDKLQRCIHFYSNYKEEFKKNFDDAIKQNKMDIDKLSNDFNLFVPPWLEVEFYENDKSIKSLSSGEKGLFTFIINILYQLSNINQKNEYHSINLFLDETDVGFHPEWQKKYLNEVIFSISKIWTKSINICFLTHSPFILSDIPKENVIFLDKVDEKTKIKYPKLDVKDLEKGNCINVSHNIELNQTFGANIHTLLSDGFFMDGGLMGEFAKEKINELIKYLRNEVSEIKTIQEAQNIINIIGEPVLKSTLQNMFDEKYSQQKKLERLKLEKTRLENEILKLELEGKLDE